MLNQGSFGSIYAVIDTEDPTNKLIAKIQKNYNDHSIETVFL